MNKEEIAKPAKKYYDNVSVGNRTKQLVYFVEQHDKPTHFELFFQENPILKTVVICKSKKIADILDAHLRAKSIKATTIHGNHRASQIQEASLGFNKDEISLLVTTSKIYETLELENVQRVLSYELPFEPESYFQALRAVDERGESILFVSAEDEKMLERIEFMMKYTIPRAEIESFSHTALVKKEKTTKKKPRHKKSKATKQDTKKED